MSITLKLVLLATVLITLFIVIKQIRKKKIQLSFCIFWIVTCIILIIAICIPNFIEQIAYMLGFEVASNMIFCVSILILFYLVFSLTIKVSQENDKNRKLVQEISILNKKIEDLKRDK